MALAGIGFTVHLDPVEGGYKASVTIDARDITLQSKDGKWTGSLEFLVVVEQLTTIPLNFSEAMFHQIQEKGLVLGARVKTPPGITGFSLAFRDIPSGMVDTARAVIGVDAGGPQSGSSPVRIPGLSSGVQANVRRLPSIPAGVQRSRRVVCVSEA